MYNVLLNKHVSEKGNVNYKGFIEDREPFEEYLDLLAEMPPSDSWSEDEKLAYWINAYNAFTIKLIIEHYPIESIEELHPTLYIPGVRSVWHKKFFSIGGVEMNLNDIEHEILRKQFEELRIHFAIVCASKSCPKLLNEAYVADKLEEQLTAQVKGFLADDFRNKISTDKVELSKIFSWFKEDFTKDGSLIDFVDQYTEIQINEDADISYLKYDWGLNE